MDGSPRGPDFSFFDVACGNLGLPPRIVLVFLSCLNVSFSPIFSSPPSRNTHRRALRARIRARSFGLSSSPSPSLFLALISVANCFLGKFCLAAASCCYSTFFPPHRSAWRVSSRRSLFATPSPRGCPEGLVVSCPVTCGSHTYKTHAHTSIHTLLIRTILHYSHTKGAPHVTPPLRRIIAVIAHGSPLPFPRSRRPTPFLLLWQPEPPSRHVWKRAQ
jgi:hypothetical protein